MTSAPRRAAVRARSGNADSKHTSGPTRTLPAVSTVTCEPRPRSSGAALDTSVSQPRTRRNGTYSPNGTSRVFVYCPRTPAGSTSTDVLRMPPSPPRASTLTSRSPPTRADTSRSRSSRSGRAARSNPTLLSPHTTRSTRRPTSDEVSVCPASKRACGSGTTPGWTSATDSRPVAGGTGSTAAHSGAAMAASRTAATPTSRPRPPPADTASSSATFATTTSALTSQTPPTAAGASITGCGHWLAPSNAHGPPSDAQERTASIATQPAGSTASAAAARRGLDRRVSTAAATAPHGAHSAPTAASTGTPPATTAAHRGAHLRHRVGGRDRPAGLRMPATVVAEPIPNGQRRPSAASASHASTKAAANPHNNRRAAPGCHSGTNANPATTNATLYRTSYAANTRPRTTSCTTW